MNINMWSPIVFLLAFIISLIYAEPVIRFDNNRVYSLNVTNEEQLLELQRLENVEGWYFWRSAYRIGDNAEVMVPPEQLSAFEQYIEHLQIDVTLKVENVQRLVQLVK